jgi:hypothetical protein
LYLAEWDATIQLLPLDRGLSFRFFRWVGLSFRINRRTELRRVILAVANDADVCLRWKAGWLVSFDCTHWFFVWLCCGGKLLTKWIGFVNSKV